MDTENKITEVVEPFLERATFNFSQEGNCLSSKDAYEFLEISCENDLGIDSSGDCFYVIKTEGWSIDNVNELQKLFDRIQKVIKK